MAIEMLFERPGALFRSGSQRQLYAAKERISKAGHGGDNYDWLVGLAIENNARSILEGSSALNRRTAKLHYCRRNRQSRASFEKWNCARSLTSHRQRLNQKTK